MLEVCVDTLEAAMAAYSAGAQRIELCTALDVGGVTPCAALVRAVRRHVPCPLMVLVRPRTGNFVYDRTEIEISADSIALVLEAGADGVVIGALDDQGSLDLPALQVMRNAAGRAQLVLHRAFDFVVDPFMAIDQLVNLGFARILTSGGITGQVNQHWNQLKRLIEYANDRLVIMPGGGVDATLAADLIHRTGCTELHGSFRLLSTSTTPDGLGHYRRLDLPAIRQVAQHLRHMSSTASTASTDYRQSL